jgi:hypothetical protein
MIIYKRKYFYIAVLVTTFLLSILLATTFLVIYNQEDNDFHNDFALFNNNIQSQDKCIDGTKFILRGNWIGKNFHGDDDLTIQLFEDDTFKIYDPFFKSEFTGQWELLEQENSIEFTYNQSDKLDTLFSLIESSLGRPLVPVKSYDVTNKSARFGLYYRKQNEFEGKCIKSNLISVIFRGLLTNRFSA